MAECDCGIGVYRVLKPRYEKTGEVTQTPEGPIRWYRVDWIHQGYADNYADARARFGGRPVLEYVGKLQ